MRPAVIPIRVVTTTMGLTHVEGRVSLIARGEIGCRTSDPLRGSHPKNFASEQFADRMKRWRIPVFTSQERGRVGRRPPWGSHLCIAFAVLGGCTHYQAAPLDTQVSAQQFSERRLDEPGLRESIARLMPQSAAAWPPREWDRGDLLAVALVRSPAIAVANAQTRVALAHETTAAQLPDPDITLQSEYARHDPYPWLYGVALNWLLRSPARRRLETNIAQLDTHNARLALMDEAWTVRHGLIAALSEWEGARRRSKLLDRLSASQERFVEHERRRVAAGEDGPVELLVAEHALIEIEQQRAQLNTEIEAAQSAVAKAVGVPLQALDGLPFVWQNWGAPPPLDESRLREMREQALRSRSDLAMAVTDYSAAEAKLQLAVARQYPQYEINPGFYWDHGIAKFPFDLSFSLPFNGNRGEIAEARAGRDLAGQRMLAIQADIYAEVAGAERAEAVARASMDAAERLSASARRQLRQSDLALRLGASDSLEHLGADIFAARAEIELVQMQARLQTSRNSLEDALHAPLSGPELKLSMAGPAAPAGAGS